MSELSLSHDSLTEVAAPTDHNECNVLLTLGQEPDGRNIVMGGPRSVVVLDEKIDRKALRAERAKAARNAQPVRDGGGRAVLPVKKRPVHG